MLWDKVSILSTFLAPFKYLSPGTTNTEDEDNLSTSSAEVKENRNVSNLGTRPLPPGDRARGSTPSIKRKRPLEEGNGGHFCKFQLIWKKLSWSMTPKNALVQLHELKPGLQYRMVSQTGPVHAPVFAVAVEVNGLTFEGTGPTKKKAKMRAAELALKSFVQFPNACQAHLAMGSGTSPCTDFTSDQADFPDTLFKEFEPSAPSEGFPVCRPMDPELLSTAYRRGRLLYHTLDLRGPARPDRPWPAPAAPRERNPVVVLNELRSGLQYVCLSETAEKPRSKSFVMAVCVDGRTFEGSGRSKKLAKGQAAQAALQALFDIRLPGHTPSRSKSNLLPQEFADSVSQLVTQKFRELTIGLTSMHARHKALAGIVMTKGLDTRQAQVIVLSSGTKCISGEHISDQGLAVNDCHAEIVARRAFLHFLYAQLELHLSKRQEDSERSIFVRLKEGGYRLRENVLFHLYVSTSPCGDARLNSPYEITTDLNSSKHLVRKFRGHLRTKIESGEGTVPVRGPSAVQTWDGILLGEQLVTMSCTDKIASIVVGSLHHTGHLSRVMSHRMEDIGQLPASYRHNRPLLSELWRSQLPHMELSRRSPERRNHLAVVTESTMASCCHYLPKTHRVASITFKKGSRKTTHWEGNQHQNLARVGILRMVSQDRVSWQVLLACYQGSQPSNSRKFPAEGRAGKVAEKELRLGLKLKAGEQGQSPHDEAVVTSERKPSTFSLCSAA
ncbi:double-stranded RNA-specific editase B2 isoform X2 [Fukomys damarensis]|uniref:double-stranded RNA-specific editase B2 isoform X2 n=1 Tax=Fukomys damarensis TaxID=885580 RepID=UPI001454FC4F|nr:double-stranded RNA-specific editase B2 isoform X2 [Fukomys damarensis]